jgi:PleD family two-component response regulator
MESRSKGTSMLASKSATQGSIGTQLDMKKRSEPIRVLLVDDHAMTREGLRSYLSTYNDSIEVVGEACNGQEALEAVKNRTLTI